MVCWRRSRGVPEEKCVREYVEVVRLFSRYQYLMLYRRDLRSLTRLVRPSSRFRLIYGPGVSFRGLFQANLLLYAFVLARNCGIVEENFVCFEVRVLVDRKWFFLRYSLIRRYVCPREIRSCLFTLI